MFTYELPIYNSIHFNKSRINSTENKRPKRTGEKIDIHGSGKSHGQKGNSGYEKKIIGLGEIITVEKQYTLISNPP